VCAGVGWYASGLQPPWVSALLDLASPTNPSILRMGWHGSGLQPSVLHHVPDGTLDHYRGNQLLPISRPYGTSETSTLVMVQEPMATPMDEHDPSPPAF
jgi:hypothetical protein